MNKSLLFALIFLVIGCKSNDTETKNEINEQETLATTDTNIPIKQIGELVIPVDSLTTKHAAKFQYYNDGEDEWYVTLNHLEHSIIFNSIDKPNNQWKIQLNRDGPNRVRNFEYPNVSGLYVHNFDSIFLFNYFDEYLYQINRQGEVITSVGAGNQFDFKGEVLSPSNFWFENGKVYLIGNITVPLTTQMAKDPGPITSYDEYLFIYDLASKTHELKLTFPEIYKSRRFTPQDYFFSIIRNPIENNYIISYPFLNEVSVTNDFENFEIKPYSKEGYSNLLANYPVESRNLRDTWMQMDRFGRIYFDPYRQWYFRFFKSGVPVSMLSESDEYIFDKYDKYYVVYDADFNPLFEWDVSDYRFGDIFFGEKGIYIGKEDGNEDEDNKTYLIFNLKEENL